ncbi:MAG: hypothetical protein CMK80_00165 [Pseudomonadales bacterium]|nr:hypothetical protein [Pseudomonadales bacterium]
MYHKNFDPILKVPKCQMVLCLLIHPFLSGIDNSNKVVVQKLLQLFQHKHLLDLLFQKLLLLLCIQSLRCVFHCLL